MLLKLSFSVFFSALELLFTSIRLFFVEAFRILWQKCDGLINMALSHNFSSNAAYNAYNKWRFGDRAAISELAFLV